MKNSLDRFKSRLEIAEDRTIESEGRSRENTQSEAPRNTRMENIEQHVRDMCNIIRISNTPKKRQKRQVK